MNPEYWRLIAASDYNYWLKTKTAKLRMASISKTLERKYPSTNIHRIFLN
jgi:hypothetical protein